MRRVTLLLFLVLLLILSGTISSSRAALAPAAGLSALREGDILFQTSKSAQSRVIRLATHSPWSHCGIVLKKGARLMVYEAAATVRYTPLETWIARGVGKRYMALRLRDAATLLDEKRLRALRRAAATFEGKPYDLLFEWSDKAQYCSELVWKIYKKGADIALSPLRDIRDFDFSHPEVKKLARQRTGTQLPKEQPVVAPSDLAASALLAPVR